MSQTTLGRVMERVENMSLNHLDQYIPVKSISFRNLDTVMIRDESHTLKPIAQHLLPTDWGFPFSISEGVRWIFKLST